MPNSEVIGSNRFNKLNKQRLRSLESIVLEIYFTVSYNSVTYFGGLAEARIFRRHITKKRLCKLEINIYLKNQRYLLFCRIVHG